MPNRRADVTLPSARHTKVTVSHADTAKPLDLNALSLTRLDEPMRDNAGVRIPTDWVWRTPDLAGAIGAALAQGGSVVMIGAQTSATNNFGRMLRQRPELASPEPVIGIQAQTLNTAPNEPLPQSQEHDFSRPLPSNQLQLLRDREGDGRHTVRLGAGITFSQVNDLVRQELGDDPRWDYCVPIDLTTTDIAHAGAVYATGAQGPSRLRVAEVAKSATLYTGAQLQHLTTPSELAGHQGLWGMTGALIELELRVFRRPKHRFGFFVPLTRSADGSWIEQVAAVLALLRDATTLHLRDGELCSDWPSGLIDGADRQHIGQIDPGGDRLVELRIAVAVAGRRHEENLRRRPHRLRACRRGALVVHLWVARAPGGSFFRTRHARMVPTVRLDVHAFCVLRNFQLP